MPSKHGKKICSKYKLSKAFVLEGILTAQLVIKYIIAF